MPDKYIADLFLNIINELARNGLINQEAWKSDVLILQNCISHMEFVEKVHAERYTDDAKGADTAQAGGSDE